MRKLTAVFAVLTSFACGVHAEEKLPFETATVVKQEVPKVQILDGTVDAVNKTTVSAQTSGQVAEVNYDVDDFVEQGAVILRLRLKNRLQA